LPVVALRFVLREILEQRGISQSELARRTGLSFTTIHRLAANKTAMVALRTLERIARALDVKPGDLIGGGD
jgi:putative transcriptional regulator